MYRLQRVALRKEAGVRGHSPLRGGEARAPQSMFFDERAFLAFSGLISVGVSVIWLLLA